ncbi:hypothetical protein NYP18_08145 [Corynebacterium sp. YIM 101645]|uniref:Lipoprotein LpqE n=1 Tax=Corynebacterium lemuris TaxID=1859292 RepID=A0ABT2FWL5_9CORY|nr:hypothetical protein [Corynebacterium lemuris]MCS5479626.1 hypothetical protein [Corynebacterium lemuris]
MEDTPVKSLKSAARRGGIISAAALSALALASCSAGQVTQTASQVAAVNGAEGNSEDGTVVVRDVTIMVDHEGEAALKFTAVNQDTTMTEHTLESVEVDGTPVDIESTTLARDCVLVADSAAGLEATPQAEGIGCIEYVEASLPNDNFAYAGNVPVVFTFDSGEIAVDATVSAPQLPAGSFDREPGAESDYSLN